MTSLGRALALVVLAASCATAPKQSETAQPRAKDSAPEKIAAQRAATPGLRLEEEDARWGVEAARQRRADAAAKQTKGSTVVRPEAGSR